MFDYKVAIPLVVSVVSLLFGIYQYLDKRKIERRSLELKNREAEIGLREKEMRSKADLVIYYVDIDLFNLYRYGSSFSSTLEPITPEEVDNILQEWISDLQTSLPFRAKLNFIGNSKYHELKQFCQNPDKGNGSDHIIRSMLIRNEGGYTATQVAVGFHDAKVVMEDYVREPKTAIEPVTIDQIDPDQAVLIILAHMNPPIGVRYGFELEPDSHIEYFDKFLDKYQKISVRPPYEVPKIVSNGSLMRG